MIIQPRIVFNLAKLKLVTQRSSNGNANRIAVCILRAKLQEGSQEDQPPGALTFDVATELVIKVG